MMWQSEKKQSESLTNEKTKKNSQEIEMKGKNGFVKNTEFEI